MRTALRDAELLDRQIRSVLNFFEHHEPRWRPFWRGLEGRDRRLRRFLMVTVEPCAALTRRGLELEKAPHSDPTPLGWDGLPLPHFLLVRRGRRPWRVARVQGWSTRPLFDLACLHAVAVQLGHEPAKAVVDDLCRRTGQRVDPRGRQAGKQVFVAVWALEQALGMAYGDEREFLRAGIDGDKTLDALREHPALSKDLTTLLARYPAASPETLPRARSAVVKVVAALLARLRALIGR